MVAGGEIGKMDEWEWEIEASSYGRNKSVRCLHTMKGTA